SVDALVVAAGPQAAEEDLLADADRVGRDLDELVAVDPLHGALDGVRLEAGEDHVLVAPRGADVRELLLAGGVDDQIVGAVVLADDHPLVDRLARPDEEVAARLQVEERVGGGLALAVADDGPALP